MENATAEQRGPDRERIAPAIYVSAPAQTFLNRDDARRSEPCKSDARPAAPTPPAWRATHF